MQRRLGGDSIPLPPSYRGRYPHVNCDSCKAEKINSRDFAHCRHCRFDLCGSCARKSSKRPKRGGAGVWRKLSDDGEGVASGSQEMGGLKPSQGATNSNQDGSGKKGGEARGGAWRQPRSGLIPLFAKASCVQEPWVATSTDFHYYGCNNEHDTGWGCTYRVLQMTLSCLMKQGCLPRLRAVPTLREIQQTLVDEKVFAKSHVGSTQWLEPSHSAVYVNALIRRASNHSSRAVPRDVWARHVEVDLRKLANRRWLIARLKTHFRPPGADAGAHGSRRGGPRTPVMFDNHVKTKAVVGIASSSNETKELM
jgi:hypothetical protein